MPYKKFKKSGRRPKRQYRKGKFSKKFKGRFRMNHRPKLAYSGPGKAPLPDYYFTKLHYQDWFNYSSSGSSGVGELIFSGNGSYDPYDAIGGIGCSGFTELAAIYQQYRVYASKITVVVKSIVDSTATGDSVFLIIPDRSNSTYSMSDVIARQASPYSKVAMLNRGSNGSQPVTIKQYRKTKHIYGESDIDDDNYASSTTGTPTNEWFWHVLAARGDQSAIAASPGFQAIVKITYYIRFEKRKALSAP